MVETEFQAGNFDLAAGGWTKPTFPKSRVPPVSARSTAMLHSLEFQLERLPATKHDASQVTVPTVLLLPGDSTSVNSLSSPMLPNSNSTRDANKKKRDSCPVTRRQKKREGKKRDVSTKLEY